MFRILSLVALGFALVFPGLRSAGAQTYHEEKYIFGGSGQDVGINIGGLFLSDENGVTRLTALSRHSRGFTTDLDNRSIVFGVQADGVNVPVGPHAGLYRIDPTSLVVDTLAGPNTLRFDAPYKIEIDQDGNYLFGGYTATSNTPPFTFQDALFRLDRSGKLTTVLAPGQISTSSRISFRL